MLQDVVNKGTGTQARLPGRPVAGKTGTADQSKDIWFVGFTPDMVTDVWGGNDADKPIAGSYVTGGTIMAKIWRQYNLAYYAGHRVPPGSFTAPQMPFEDFQAEPGVLSEIDQWFTQPSANSITGGISIPSHWQTKSYRHQHKTHSTPQQQTAARPPHSLLGKIFHFFSHF